ncbi:MAG: Vms1/Ankzf1 family peptidyl-tRNA hydrolase, partial [Pseudonocardiaceae bacterium]
VLLPRAGELDAVVLGGDTAALRTLAADPRLTVLLARAEPRVLDIPEPRRAVLDEAARRARCVEVQLNQPPD